MRLFYGSDLRTPLYFILILLHVSLFCLGRAEEPAPAAPEEDIQAEETLSLQDLYGALDPQLPAMGWLLPDISWNINSEEASHVSSSFIERVVRSGGYKPVSLMNWYNQEYKNSPPRDLIQLLGDMKKQKMPASCFFTIKIRPFSDKIIVIIGLYNVANSNEATYVHRILPNLSDSWDKELPEMFHELFLRYEESQRPFFSKNIYCESFSVRFYSYYELENQEFSFTEIPFRNIDGTDFKNDCDVVSDLIGLRLHASGLANISLGAPAHLTQNDFYNRSSYVWGIRGELKISGKINVFHLEIYNYKRKNIVAAYDIPFYGYDTQGLYGLTDLALPFILDSVLTENEKKQVVFIEKPPVNIYADKLYGSRGYLGPNYLIRTFILPSGLSRLLFKKGGFTDSSSWNRGLFNAALLVNPSGTLTKIYTQKDILYAEKLFE